MKLKKISIALGVAMMSAMSGAHAIEENVLKNIETRVGAIENKMIGWRRDIHAHPELSNQEHRTAGLVADHLRKLGLEVKTGVGGTGVLGVLKGGKPGKVVALRADMDALPVKELVNLPFASRAKGTHMGKEVDVMHACGHDAHTAILMATAEVLAGMKDQLPGTVKFLFQPAEEGPSEPLDGEHDHIGALAMVDAGVLDNPKVDAVFGLHMIPAFPVGTIGYKPGPILASGDTFAIKVTGRQTHGGFPWNGVDPIVSASQIVMGLQTIVSRQLNLTKEPAVISIGSIHGGNRENIIPESVELLGTLRTFDDGMRADTQARMRTTAESIAQASGAKAEVSFVKPGYSTTVNDETLTATMLPTLKQVTGGHAVVTPKLSASEDFSEFSKKVPGMFFFLGSSTPGKEKTAAPNHSPKFEIDEASLAVGARAMTALTLDYLAQP
ncbi:amidohydrolase [Cognatazoarcus halotolerans]|uniref:amidohydrolase n=1 Tax=Cognatazoarcus halotolerans TaxID=2686016 RepID=UPI00135A724F|nr:amidohydrolase [Cognatazoarcus halotolerans]MCB1900852.1 amidohydrolase [Rhodocyclaceae bacterium]MCP5308101.1 amidohydrolase [Zoogloeaceae bacterium]